MDQVVRPTKFPNLYMALSGQPTRDVSDLIAATRQLVAQAAAQLATVIIDTSPLNAASDPLDLLPVVDHVVMVVRSGGSAEADLVDARYYGQANIKNRVESYLQMLGAIHQVQGHWDQALDYYRRVIAIRPTAQAYSNIGAISHQRSDFAAAVDAYRQAIALRPNAPATHRNLGDSYLRLGRRDDALTAYRKAVDLARAELRVNPSDVVGRASLAVYEAKAGDHAAARAAIGEVTRRAPDDPAIWSRVAQVHALAGRTDDALNALVRAVELGYPRADAAAADEFAVLRGQPAFERLFGR